MQFPHVSNPQVNACLKDLEKLLATKDPNLDPDTFRIRHENVFNTPDLLKILIETISRTCSIAADHPPQTDLELHIKSIGASQDRIDLMSCLISILENNFDTPSLGENLREEWQFFLDVLFDDIIRNLNFISHGFHKECFTKDRVFLVTCFDRTQKASILFSDSASPIRSLWTKNNPFLLDRCIFMLRFPIFEAKYKFAKGQDESALQLLDLTQAQVEKHYNIPVDQVNENHQEPYLSRAPGILSEYLKLKTEIESNVKRKIYKDLYDCIGRSLTREDISKNAGNPTHLEPDVFKKLLQSYFQQLIQSTAMEETHSYIQGTFILMQAAHLINYHNDPEILGMCHTIATRLQEFCMKAQGSLLAAYVLKYLKKQLTNIDKAKEKIQPLPVHEIKTAPSLKDEIREKITLQKEKNADEIRIKKATIEKSRETFKNLQKTKQENQQEKQDESLQLSLVQEKQALEDAISQLEKDNETLEKQCVEERAKHNRAQQARTKEIAAVKRQIPTLETTLAQSRQQLGTITQESQDANTQYEQTVTELTQQNQRDKTEQATQAQVLVQLKEQLKQATQQLADLEKDIKTLVQDHQCLTELMQEYHVKPLKFHVQTLSDSHKSLCKKLGFAMPSHPPQSVPVQQTSEKLLEENLKEILLQGRASYTPVPVQPVPHPVPHIILSPKKEVEPRSETRTHLLPKPVLLTRNGRKAFKQKQ